MSNLGLAGLVMAYVALASFLLSLHLYSNWNFWAKAGVTSAVAAFYFVTYFSIPQLLGWPTSHGLPEKFRLVAYHIKGKEHIYLWAKERKGGTERHKPRAYVVPYTETLHKAVRQAGQSMRTGLTIIGEVEEVSSSPRPKNAPTVTRRTEEVNIIFQDAPNTSSLTKD